MKKKVLTLLSALVVTLAAQADNLVVNAVTVQQGGKATVEVGLNNPDNAFTAFQMALQLPAGVRGVAGTNGRLAIQKSARFDDHSLSSSFVDGGIQFTCLSMTSAPISGNDGTLFSFEIQADASLPVGTELTAKFTEILFTRAASAQEVELSDVALKITVGGVSSSMTLVDGQPFARDNDVQVQELTYTRTFRNTNWQALYLPFEVNVEDIADDFEVAYINAVHQYDDDGNGEVDRTTLEWFYQRRGVVRANDPTYIIRAKTAGEKTIKVSNVTLKAAVAKEFTMSNRSTFFTFCGTYSGIAAGAVPGFWAYSGGTVKQASATASLGSFRWYLLINGRGAEVKKMESVFVDGEVTGIQGVRGTEQENAAYDLTGRRVERATKGIYIMNGKKIIKK